MARTTDTDLIEELSADLRAWLLVSGLSYRDTAEMIGAKMNVVHRAATGLGMIAPDARAKLRAMLGHDEPEWREIYDHVVRFREQYEHYRRHRGDT